MYKVAVNLRKQAVITKSRGYTTMRSQAVSFLKKAVSIRAKIKKRVLRAKNIII